MFKPTLALIAIALAFPTTATAKPLDPTHVPANAKWVVHFDFESLSKSEFADAIRQRKPKAIKAVRQWIRERYGIDMPDDLRSATAYSRDYRVHTGTVVLKAAYDTAKVETQLTKAMNHRTTQWQGHTLHTVTLSKQTRKEGGPSGDEEMTVVMLDNDTVIFGSSVPNTKKAIELFAGEAASLDASDSPLLTEAVRTAWMYGAAIDLQKLKDHPVSMPILSQHEKIVWSFGKRDGQIYEQADLVASSDDVAKSMMKILDGIVAYESLWSAGSQPMSAIMKDVRVTQQGNTSGFRWQGDSKTVVAALDDALARLASWKRMLGSEKTKTTP